MSQGDLDLRRRFERLKTFGSLRRSLRVAESDVEIAETTKRFVVDVLGCSEFSCYCAEKEDTDFLRLASTRTDAPETVERGEALTAALTEQPILSGARLAELGFELAPTRIALALRASPEELIGFLVVDGVTLESELLDELVFDVETVLGSRMLTRLRTEELAVLEIQERELVGLLRDVEARDEIIQRDLEEARQFQLKMLGAPPRVPGAKIEVVYKPLGLVGGDLYAVSTKDSRLRLFVADATGHGVRASLTTMFIKSGYEAVRIAAPDPASVLLALNDMIAATYKSAEMLFSAVCVDVDLTSGRVLISTAAHPAVCVVQGTEATFLESSGAFLGLRAGMRYETEETQIAAGDAVYLYSDGFSEARRNHELFGDDRLRAAVLAAHREGTEAGKAVLDAVTTFLAGEPMDDDGTFLGMRYLPEPR
jgi:sigma-B regulation protein RsbU (phosphoserine phosphatase)